MPEERKCAYAEKTVYGTHDQMQPELQNVLSPQLVPPSVETVFFGGMGEPLFHKDICEMVRIAADTGVEVELLTNGTLLTEPMIHRLIDAGLSRLWISIDDLDCEAAADAAAEPSGHDHSGIVLRNIRTLNQIRQHRLSSLSLGITFGTC